MTNGADETSLIRHTRVVRIAGLTGVFSLVLFRMMIEFGFGPGGSLGIRGVPLEYGFLTWFLALWALTFDRQKLAGAAQRRVVAYEWCLATLGLAAIMWLVHGTVTLRLIGSAAWAYWFACACVCAIFISAASVKQIHTTGVLRSVLPDSARVLARPTTWLCAIVAISILAIAPRSAETPAGGRAFQLWYSRQVRATVPASWQVSPVTLVELTDYQCPVCRQAATRYQKVIRTAEDKYGDAFAFVRVDFPLDNECNPSGRPGAVWTRHPGACEAAAAVRLARLHGEKSERQVVEWLWEHQSQLTRDIVFNGMREHFGLDLPGHYGELVRAISREAEEGRRLGVSGTPTFFLNGRRLPLLSADTMETAIRIEMNLMASEPRGAHR
jgi:protein-disulfide isomerase